jgi:hypothetical protein
MGDRVGGGVNEYGASGGGGNEYEERAAAMTAMHVG